MYHSLKNEIPKINFDKSKNLGIEVMNLSELLVNLNKSKDHDPFSAHRIEFFLILIISKGSYTHFVDFKPYKLKEESTLFVAKNQIHHFTHEIETCEGFCIVFNSLYDYEDYFLSDMLKLNRLFNYHLESPIIHKKEMRHDSLKEVASTLYDEYHVQNNFAKIEILNALLQIMLLKAERIKEFQSVKGVNIHWLEAFNKFRNLLENEYSKSRSSRDYASKLFISYKHLNDIVKTFTGKTAKAFIDDFVTIEIKRYLVSTSLSVKQISYKTGFEDSSNLVKFFKKNTRITPLQFRKKS